MEDEDFWGHTVKKSSDKGGNSGEAPKNKSVDHESPRGSLDKNRSGRSIDISTKDLVNLQSNLERLRIEPRITDDISSTSVLPVDKRHSVHTNAESEYRHTRSPSYKKSHRGHSSENDGKLSEQGNGDKDEAYSENFETSDAMSDGSDVENDGATKAGTADRLKPFLAEKTVEMAKVSREATKPTGTTRVKVKKQKSKPKHTAVPPQKPKLSPRATKPKRRLTNNAPMAASNIGSRPTASKLAGGALNDPMRRIRSAALRSEIIFLKKQLSESKTENRTLRQVQRRQEAALARSDTTRAAMPTLLERQAEEVRITKEQLRMQKEKQRELERLLRERNDRLIHALDKAKRLEKMLKDKGISYRAQEGNTENVDALKQQLEDKDKRIWDLERRVTLLVKNHKHQLIIEVMRHKETQRKLRDLEDASKNRRTGKMKGYYTTRTARQSTSGETSRSGALGQLMEGRVPEKPAKSIHSSRQDSIEEDIFAESNTFMASQKGPPSKKPLDTEVTNADKPKLIRPSRARLSRKTTKVTQSTVEDAVDFHKAGYARPVVRDESLEKQFTSEQGPNKTDILDQLIGASTFDNAFTMSQKRTENTTRPSTKIIGSSRIISENGAVKSTPPFQSAEPLASKPASLDDSASNEPKLASNPTSILDDILPATKPLLKAQPVQQAPKTPPKANAEFLDDLFGPKINARTNSDKNSKTSSGADSGFSNDSTPKQAQSSQGTPPTKFPKARRALDLDGDLFAPTKPSGPKAASNGSFPWETDSAEKAGDRQETAKKPSRPTNDFFSSTQGLGTVI